MPKVHYLKTWTVFFDAVERREKTFEVRVNDRDYQVGDLLILQCYDPQAKTYDGREERREVTYILDGEITFHNIEVAVLGMKEVPS